MIEVASYDLSIYYDDGLAPIGVSMADTVLYQLAENCRFISRTGAFVSVVTTKEALGAFKAVVVRIQDGQRQPLFSESAATIPEALQALHARSAEAVQNHIDANGWDFVAVPKKHWTRKASDKDQGDSDVESSYSQSASSTVTLSDASDDDLVSVGGHPSHRANESRAGKKKASKPSKKGKGRVGRSRSRSRSQSRSPSRSRSPRRNRSSSVGTVTSSSGDEDPRVSPRPPLFFRPNRMRAPNYPPGWEPGHPPVNLSLAPTNPNIMRGQQPPPPPPPPPPRPFPGVTLMPNPGQPLPMPPPFPVLNEQQRMQRMQQLNQIKTEALGLARQRSPAGASTQRPNQPYPFITLPARRPESTQSNGSDGNSANKPAPNTGYNPYTTVFSAPAPPQSPTHDVLLHIRWRHPTDTTRIREERVLEQIPRLSVSDLKKAAITHVQRQTTDINSKDSPNAKQPSTFLTNNNRTPWTVSLKRLSIQDGITCAISPSISDDASLLRLIQATDTSPQSDKIPVFDVDVYDRARGPLDGPSTDNNENNNNNTPICFPNNQSPRVIYPFTTPPMPQPGWGGQVAAVVNEKAPMNARRKIDGGSNTAMAMNPQRPQQQQQQQARPATARPDFAFIPPPPNWYPHPHQQPPQGAGFARPSGGAAPPPPAGQVFPFIMPNVTGTGTGNVNGNMRPMSVGTTMPMGGFNNSGPGNGNGSSQGGMKTSSGEDEKSSARKKGFGLVSVGGGNGMNTPGTSAGGGSGRCEHTHLAQPGGAGMHFVEVVEVEEEREDGDGDVYFESDA